MNQVARSNPDGFSLLAECDILITAGYWMNNFIITKAGIIMYQFSDENRKALERLSLAMAFFQDIDGKNIPLLVSDGFCALLGIEREQVMQEQTGSKFERIHPEDVGRISQAVRDFWNKQSDYDVIYRVREADNEYHYIHSIAFWWPMEDGPEVIVVVYLDLHKWGNEIRKRSTQYGLFKQDHFYTDQLTGLPNINYLNQFGDERVNTLRIQKKTPVLIYTDVQAMQSYNNQYGFTRGNDLMRLIAEELKAAFPGGLVTRGAEDHFVVIETFDDRESLRAKLHSVNEHVREKAYGNTYGIQVGICLFEKDANTAETMDRARQAVKQIREDLNRVVRFYSQGDDESYWNQRYIVENFEKAMEEGWIKVFYQCVSRVKTGKVASLEALARWIDPIRGTISPGEFIPVLRKFHQLHKLDLYMAEQVCREIPIRAENGFPIVPVSMNFTAQDFDYVDIPAKLNELYDRYGISRYGGKESLVIEITEQDIASATDRFREQLMTLKNDGYSLWLDDFGSGYSSLNMFSRFDFHMIKFDMELLRDLDGHNGANRRIIRAMVGVAKELGIHTLAEGMETEGQRQFLLDCGCELAQGFLFHKPEPLESFVYKSQQAGHQHRVCETPEERKTNMKNWLNGNRAGGGEK